MCLLISVHQSRVFSVSADNCPAYCCVEGSTFSGKPGNLDESGYSKVVMEKVAEKEMLWDKVMRLVSLGKSRWLSAWLFYLDRFTRRVCGRSVCFLCFDVEKLPGKVREFVLSGMWQASVSVEGWLLVFVASTYLSLKGLLSLFCRHASQQHTMISHGINVVPTYEQRRFQIITLAIT